MRGGGVVVEADDSTFERLVSPDAELTLLGEGYQFTEGPVWVPDEGCLYFSDVPSDRRWRWSEAGGMELAASPAFKGNGMALDVSGRVVVCEQVTSSVVRLGPGIQRELVAFHHDGGYLNSPNDVAVRRTDGSIWFTDPDFGRLDDWAGVRRSPALGFAGVFRVPTDSAGDAELVVDRDEFEGPNGLCFSPDEQILYVNDSPRAHVKAFDILPDGSLGPGRITLEGIGGGFSEEDAAAIREGRPHGPGHEAGAVDGMRCDELGNLWITGPGGVWVVDPEGRRIGRIRTPEIAGNVEWGGADLRTLFIMTSSTVHSLPTLVGPSYLVLRR
jgi:gluconolactonase